MTKFNSFMDAALEQAHAAQARGEIPVGAVLVKDGKIIAAAGNETRQRFDPTAHAEILVIRDACAKLEAERLSGCDLYVTLEPCPMCAAAIANARIKRLYYAASDPKSGGIEQGPRVFDQPQCHHKPEVYDGIGAQQATALLKSFFKGKR